MGKRNIIFFETNYFNLILIFIIGGNIIIFIRDKIKNNSLQAKRHCVPSELNSFLQKIVNHGNSFLQNQNQTKCNSFQKETKREIIFCFMIQKNDSIIHNCVYSGNSIIRDRKRDESEGLFALTGRNPLRIFLIISGSMSRKYF